EVDVDTIARVIGARESVGRARTAPEMRHHHQPPTGAKVVADCLGVRAATTPFKTVKQHESGLIQREMLSEGDRGVMEPALNLSGTGTGHSPVKVDKVAVWSIHTFACKADAIVRGAQGGEDGLAVPIGQPARRGTIRYVETGSHRQSV